MMDLLNGTFFTSQGMVKHGTPQISSKPHPFEDADAWRPEVSAHVLFICKASGHLYIIVPAVNPVGRSFKYVSHQPTSISQIRAGNIWYLYISWRGVRNLVGSILVKSSKTPVPGGKRSTPKQSSLKPTALHLTFGVSTWEDGKKNKNKSLWKVDVMDPESFLWTFKAFTILSLHFLRKLSVSFFQNILVNWSINCC